MFQLVFFFPFVFNFVLLTIYLFGKHSGMSFEIDFYPKEGSQNVMADVMTMSHVAIISIPISMESDCS